jgi:hypothetical protein
VEKESTEIKNIVFHTLHITSTRGNCMEEEGRRGGRGGREGCRGRDVNEEMLEE